MTRPTRIPASKVCSALTYGRHTQGRGVESGSHATDQQCAQQPGGAGARQPRRADPAAGHAGDDDPADPAIPAGRAVHLQHRPVHRRPAGMRVRPAAAGLRRVPDHPAGGDPVAPGAERCLDPRGAAPRPRRPWRRGQGDPGLRRSGDRRQLRGRGGGVRDPHDHQLRGGDQGRRADFRSQRALHPGCHARQADGHRRRPQRRPDRAGGSQEAPQRGGPGGRLLRFDGRCQQVRPRRRHRRPADSLHQPDRRRRHRHDPAFDVLRRRRQGLRPADHR